MYNVFAASFFLLAPYLSNYVFIDAISFGDLSVIISLILIVMRAKYNAFLLYSILVSLIVIVLGFLVLYLGGALSSRFYRASFFLLILSLFLSARLDFYRCLYKCYIFATLFFCSVLIGQVLLYYGFDLVLPLQLPLKTYEEDTLTVIDVASAGFRTGGLFKEPSYFAIYVLPALFLFVMKGEIRRHLVVVVALILSTSSLGIAFSAISFLFYFKFYVRRKLVFFISLFGMTLLLGAGFLFLGNNVFGLDRFFEIFINGGTLNARFFPIFDILSISGSGLANPALYIQVGSSAGPSEWYNSFIYLLAAFGWIFILPFLLFLHRIGIVNSGIILFLLLTTGAFSTAAFTVFVTMLYIQRIHSNSLLIT